MLFSQIYNSFSKDSLKSIIPSQKILFSVLSLILLKHMMEGLAKKAELLQLCGLSMSLTLLLRKSMN